jgi:hypothetical protein
MKDLLLQRVYNPQTCVNILQDLQITLLTRAHTGHFFISIPD